MRLGSGLVVGVVLAAILNWATCWLPVRDMDAPVLSATTPTKPTVSMPEEEPLLQPLSELRHATATVFAKLNIVSVSCALVSTTRVAFRSSHWRRVRVFAQGIQSVGAAGLLLASMPLQTQGSLLEDDIDVAADLSLCNLCETIGTECLSEVLGTYGTLNAKADMEDTCELILEVIVFISFHHPMLNF